VTICADCARAYNGSCCERGALLGTRPDVDITCTKRRPAILEESILLAWLYGRPKQLEVYVPKNDTCQYHTSYGCGLFFLRPLICKRFPFFKKDGRWGVMQKGQGCLAADHADGDVPKAALLLNTSLVELEATL
jgi:hypothetical protein